MKKTHKEVNLIHNIMNDKCVFVPFRFPSPKITTFSLGGPEAPVCAKVGRKKPENKLEDTMV